MNQILRIIHQRQTKTNRDKMVTLALSNPAMLDVLLDCYFSDKFRVNQHAAWPIGVIGEKNPVLLYPYLEKMIDSLEKTVHNAVVRNTIKILSLVEIPEELEGKVYDICYHHLNNPQSPIAIRVYSMTVLSNMAIKYPDLKNELIEVIELYYPTGSAGFKSRAKKEIKRLMKS